MARRTRLEFLAAIALAAVASGGSPCDAGGSPESLAALLEREGDRPGVSVALHFLPLHGDGTVVTRDADRLLPPASVQKVILSAAALEILGPDYTMETRLVAAGPVVDGILQGDLHLSGDGDPFLVSERVWLLAREAAAGGLRRVEGGIVVDLAVDARLDSIRAPEDRESPYAAPVSSIGVNFNSVTILVLPGGTTGGAAQCQLDPCPIPGIGLTCEALTSPPGAAPSLEARRASAAGGEVWTVTGTIPAGSPPIRLYRATREPGLAAAGIVGCLLQREGIQLTGENRVGPVAPGATAVIAKISSHPLGELIRRMNCYSNNSMADRLLLLLGGGGGSRAGAIRLDAWLLSRGIPGPPAVVVDGSGLDPGNRVTARQIAEILRWAEGREAIFADLFASFPRPGGAGTMERRFRGVDPPIRMRAKTGTLGEAGVATIAGYIDAPVGGRYAFCILQQAAPAAGLKVADLRGREERWLAEFSRP